MDMKSIVYAGQRVIGRDGTVKVVAFIAPNGQVYAFGSRGLPVPFDVVCDAWGGESALDLIDSRSALNSPLPAPAARSARNTSRASLRLAA